MPRLSDELEGDPTPSTGHAEDMIQAFHDVDGWMEFLDARMRVIKSATSKGYTPSQLEELVNIKGTQTVMLMAHAKSENNG